ncbi:hypothetical protein K4S71_02175 [Staphylococcus epidermidis]|nr:hypothetical protein [Staphylococcus epidermidis]MCG1262245.1 hypothetical protein [Staphylococcus epidermidis]MCG1302919.1 hypothetical protein [Staphylococcus epidermidis]MCG1385695.1 hypothetical protein [Staphylococcus epidermidis]MCG1502069.1 hypothetical protein [Staphylococcus epidermidis]
MTELILIVSTLICVISFYQFLNIMNNIIAYIYVIILTVSLAITVSFAIGYNYLELLLTFLFALVFITIGDINKRVKTINKK